MIDQHAADALPSAADGTSPPHGLADTTPTIANLDGDMIVLTTAGTVRLDQGTQAIVTDPDADPRYLTVYLWDPAASDSLGIDTNGTGITLSNEQNGVSEVRIDGDLIATFSGGDDTYIYITLTPAATMDDVQRLVRAITYTSTVTNPTQVVRNSIEIELTDRSGDTAYASVDVVVAPAGTLVLSGEADDLAGTGADDLFIARGADLDDGDQLTGGGGSDTLRLEEGGDFDLSTIALTGIETIEGTSAYDRITMSAAQLRDLARIDGHGGFDYLRITGTAADPNVDLRALDMVDVDRIELMFDGARIVLDDRDTAMRVYAYESSGDQLVLTSGVLTAQEREVLHHRGIDSIENNGLTTTRVAPVIAGLGGDQVASNGSTAVHLDTGTQADITDDDGLLGSLVVRVTTRTSATDIIGIDTSVHPGGDSVVLLSGDLHSGTTVNILTAGGQSIYIGYIEYHPDAPSALAIEFTADATPELVETLIRNLTYRSTAGDLAQDLTIEIKLADIGGRTTVKTTTVLASVGDTFVLTSGADSFTGTGSSDVFTTNVAHLSAGDVLTGGGGNDTLQLVGGGEFYLPGITFTGIETILGSLADDSIGISAAQLQNVTRIDGGGGDHDDLMLLDGTVSLVGKTLVGIETIFLSETTRNLTVGDAATAMLVNGTESYWDTLTVASGTLTQEQRALIHRHGVDTIVAGGVTTTHIAPQTANLNGDVLVVADGAAVHLDSGTAAVLSDDDGAISVLRVSTRYRFNDDDYFGVDTLGGGIQLENGLNQGSIVTVDGTAIGHVENPSNGQSSLVIRFYDDPTITGQVAKVEKLIRALTYRNASGRIDEAIDIAIDLTDIGNRTSAHIVTAAPPSIIMLTAGVDNLTGTAGDDVFSASQAQVNDGDVVVGGGGNDTLELRGGGFFFLSDMNFSGIETITGSDFGDTFVLNAAQLNDVSHIDGVAQPQESDALQIYGTTISLVGKTISNIDYITLGSDNAVVTVDSRAKAMLINGYQSQGDHLNLVGNDSLTAQDIDDLHVGGIDKISVNGTVLSERHAPVIGNLGGDQAAAVAGNAVRLDTGALATIADDDGAINFITARITTRGNPQDELGLDLSNGLSRPGGEVLMNGGVAIATITESPGFAFNLSIYFLATATIQDVEKVLRSLTYRNVNGHLDQNLEIEVRAYDPGGRFTAKTVTVVPGGVDPDNTAPTDIRLGGETAREVAETALTIGPLSAADATPGTAPVTFVFDSSAEGGGNAGGLFVIEAGTLKVAAGRALDYEALAAGHKFHTVHVKATDSDGGVSATQALKVMVSNVNEAPRFSGSSAATVVENVAGATVATLSAADPDGDPMTYSIAPNGDPSGKFEMVGTTLKLKAGIGLDYDAPKKSFAVTLRSSDGNLTDDRVFTIAVANDTRDDGTGRADRIVGTASDETIAGGRGNDRLSGQGGDDVLIGGAGNDTLTGGSGKDVFTFTIKPNARTNGDKVVDFDPTRDRIAFENAVFKALGKAGKLKKAFFTISDDGQGTAKDGNDHVIYDRTSGALFHDVDGAGGKAPEMIAMLRKNLKGFDASDLLVI